MIAITLVLHDGVLIGRTVSDRWNLLALGCPVIEPSRNQTSLKRLRRLHPEFVFRVRSGSVDWFGTADEQAAFDSPQKGLGGLAYACAMWAYDDAIEAYKTRGLHGVRLALLAMA